MLCVCVGGGVCNFQSCHQGSLIKIFEHRSEGREGGSHVNIWGISRRNREGEKLQGGTWMVCSEKSKKARMRRGLSQVESRVNLCQRGTEET